MHKIKIVALLFILTLSCGNKKEKSENIIIATASSEMIPKSLLDNVRLAINPKFQNWVLFENGTYIIFDDIKKVGNIENESIQLMKEFGPVNAGGPAGDFNVTSLDKTEGWVVSGHGYGMYTYVNPKELDVNSPDDLTIGLYGRSKRNKDGLKPIIIHISSTEK